LFFAGASLSPENLCCFSRASNECLSSVIIFIFVFVHGCPRIIKILNLTQHLMESIASCLITWMSSSQRFRWSGKAAAAAEKKSIRVYMTAKTKQQRKFRRWSSTTCGESYIFVLGFVTGTTHLPHDIRGISEFPSTF